MKFVFLGAALSLFLVSCSDDGKKGSAIGAPDLRPPIENSTPTALKGSATASLFEKLNFLTQKAHADGTTEINTLQSEIFSSTGNGPLHVLRIIGNVDSRMESLNSRALEFQRLCLTEEAKAFSYPQGFQFVHDANYSFDMFFQCYEELSSELKMAFGIRNNKLYLMEVQSSESTFNGVILAQADVGSDNVQIWILSTDEDQGQSKSLFIESVAGQVMKFSIGGHTQNNSTTCGMKLAASETENRIHLSGIFADSLNAGDCTGTNPTTVNLCVRSTDLTQTEADCAGNEAVALTALPELNYTTLFNTAPPLGVNNLNEFNAHAKSLIDGLIANADFSGLTEFNEGVPE